LTRLSPQERVLEILTKFRVASNPFSLSVVRALLASLHDVPCSEGQRVLHGGLVNAVVTAQPDNVRLFLQHGACARSDHDYIMYLAALSGRADVMELLLGAADVDAECAARYREQMNEPAGLLGIAQQLRERMSSLWWSVLREFVPLPNSSDELNAALSGGSIAAVEWLMSLIPPPRLSTYGPFVQAVRSGNLALVRMLNDPRSCLVSRELRLSKIRIPKFLSAARETRDVDMIKLLFLESLSWSESPSGERMYHPALLDMRAAVQVNDPSACRFLLACYESDESKPTYTAHDIWGLEGLPTLFDACMTGNLEMLGDVWRFVRCAMRNANSPELFHKLQPRIDRVLQLCTEGDLTPVIMVLMTPWHEAVLRYAPEDEDHPMVLAARCGHLPAVRLWLAQGIPAQWALSAAVKHGQREVVSCLIAHGATPSELSPFEQRLQQSLLQA